jgi:uncharacterized protein
MIKHKKLPQNITELLPKAAAFLNSLPEVQFVYLFGGLAKGEPSPLSDLDIAIYLNPDEDTSERKLDILGKLIDILHTDEIDLVILNRAPLPLRMQILKNKKILVDKAPFNRHAYESLTMREYFDFSFIEKGILKRRFFNG